MNRRDLFAAYLQAYAAKDIDAIAAMFADDVHLRDWNISVRGKEAALAETARNFAAAARIEIAILGLCDGPDSVSGELRIVVDAHAELHVVDVLQFAADGRIAAIRAYRGRADE